MKRSSYTIIIASDKDSNFSFNISRKLVNFILVFVMGVVVLSVLGLLRVIGHDELTRELSDLHRFRIHAGKLIDDLNGWDSFLDYTDADVSLSEYFSDSLMAIPITSPVDGYVTQGLVTEGENFHTGVDIAAKAGELIRSPAEGLVVFSGVNGDLGKTIILSHQKGYFTVFGHNDTNLVQEREFVSKQQPIAKVGGSGVSKGPHLHFEIWQNSTLLDPRDFIEEYKKKDVSI